MASDSQRCVSAAPLRCVLGHTRRAMECPACGEAATGEAASDEHWRWYRSRTSSKRIKALIDEHLRTETRVRAH